MKTRKTRRLGFTLVEMVAVGAAVSLLGAQILDGILQSKEAANRTRCKNNLKMIGLALHNYHDTCLKFPPGWVGGDSEPKQANVFGVNGIGWQTLLTPYLDQAPLYNTINFSVSVSDEENAKWIGKSFETLRCTADPFKKKTWTMKDAEGKDIATVATANYVASFGTSDFSKCEKMKPGEVCTGDGVFFHNGSLGVRDIKDGLSHTIGAGERLTNDKLDRMSTFAGVFSKAKSPFARILGTSDQALDAKEPNVSGYGSAHKGMTHMMILDGSVRAMKSDTDLKVLQALTTRAGGEELPADEPTPKPK